MVEKKLRPEQRIYIGGKVKTENTRINYEHHQELEVLANELFLLESNPKITDSSTSDIPMQIDQNFVEMLAFVGTSVQHERNSSTFSILTHFTKQCVERSILNEILLHYE